MCEDSRDGGVLRFFFGIDSNYLGRMSTIYALKLIRILSLINFCYILEFGDWLNLMHIHE